MRNTWRHFFRRIVSACVVSGTIAWSSAMCYAVQLAYDVATNTAYNDGWDEGDNGGTGFEPWNFDTDFMPPGGEPDQHRMDGPIPPGSTPAASAYNALGRAWTLMNLQTQGGDVARAGRGFPALQVGQTIRLVIDNPTEEFFFRGYFVRFNSRNGESGGGSICYGGAPCTPGTSPVPKLDVREFYSFGPPPDPGKWSVATGLVDNDTTGSSTDGFKYLGLVDTDTANSGAQIDLKLTAPDTFQLTVDPFGPAATNVQSGTLSNPGEPIDWLEFTFFNTEHGDGFDTDFYIRSMEIIGPDPVGVPGDYNSNGKVDAADYVVWRDHSGGFQLTNEVAGVTPGQVTAEDYTAWRNRFGNTSGSGSTLGGTSIPEPSTFVYLVAAAAGLTCSGRGRLPRPAAVAVRQHWARHRA